jgi:hypothetical protein
MFLPMNLELPTFGNGLEPACPQRWQVHSVPFLQVLVRWPLTFCTAQEPHLGHWRGLRSLRLIPGPFWRAQAP